MDDSKYKAQRSSNVLSILAFLVCLSAILLSFFRITYHIFSHSDGYLAIPEDDFFYYFITAKHILHEGISTFDGRTLTNGYHPLWMLVVIVIETLSFGSETVFFLFYAIICSLSSFITYRLTVSIMHKAFDYSWVIHCSTILTSLTSTWIIFSGMEVTLTIPLYLLLILKVQEFSDGVLTKKNVFIFGFLSSLVILSRLDSIIDVSFFTVYLFISSQGSMRQKAKLLPYLFIAESLLVLYFASNYIFFGSFATMSAQAKQLKSTGGIGFSVLGDLRSSRNSFISVWIFPPAVILHLIFKTVFGHSKRLLLMLTLLVPVIHLIIFRTFSDWYLFAWYTYAFHIANGIALASLLSLVSRVIPERFTNSLGYSSILAVSLIILVPIFNRTVDETVKWNPHPGSIYAHSKKMKAFTDAHPGVYAMGDRAGLTAYVTNTSILQIEGIMADRRMIRHIAAEDNLCAVLREYNVNYVIFSTYTPMLQQNCSYSIEVPFEMQSGARSKKMKGSFSEQPVYYYESSNDPRIPIIIYTYIFKISYVV